MEGTLGRQLYDVNLGWTQSLGGELGKGLVITAAVDVTGYQSNDSAVTVRANAPSIAIGFGRAWSGDDWSVMAAASLGVLYTFNTPPQGAQPLQQGFLRPAISTSYNLTPSLVGQLGAAYSLGTGYYRLAPWLGYRIAPGVAVGPALSFEGGRDWHQNQVGVQANLTISERFELQIAAGYVNRGASVQLGVSVNY